MKRQVSHGISTICWTFHHGNERINWSCIQSGFNTTNEVRDFEVGFAWSILTDVRNFCVCTVVEVTKRCSYNGKPTRWLRTRFPAQKILREVRLSFVACSIACRFILHASSQLLGDTAAGALLRLLVVLQASHPPGETFVGFFSDYDNPRCTVSLKSSCLQCRHVANGTGEIASAW